MQIKLHSLEGYNALAYGDFKFIFDEHTVYQLIGSNGGGKSSLPVILEEVLYNKNSRGFAKGELPNRYSDSKNWWGRVTFSKNEDLYIVHKDVKSTSKVTFTKNGEDISGHTATQTYKLIQDVLGGLDYKTFSKLVYQSTESSLDFLTATDANRKKFLVGLLGLEQFSEYESIVKDSHKASKTELDKLTGRVEIIESWLKENSEIPDEISLVDVPDIDSGLEVSLNEKLVDLRSVERDNKLVEDHNKRTDAFLQREKDFETLAKKVSQLEDNLPAPAEDKSAEIQSVTRDLTSVETDMRREKNLYQTFKSESEQDSCPTCGSHLDVSEKEKARDQAKKRFNELKELRVPLQEKVQLLEADQELYNVYTKSLRTLQQAQNRRNNFDLGEEQREYKHKTDVSLLNEEITELQARVHKCKTDITLANDHNLKAQINNAKREENTKQHNKYVDELAELCDNLEELQDEVFELAELSDAFSPRGYLNYKIESEVKEFEDLINKYLSIFTQGKFALEFKLDGSKLKVIVYADGYNVTMHSLSTGERSKVNVSTLLAIRNLMSGISKTELNLLFLDEVVSVLDPEAMDLLVEIMLEEKHLNTFIVSHGYCHPLTHSIYVKNTDGISKVIDG